MKPFRYEDLELVGYLPPEERPRSGWVIVYVLLALAIVVFGILGIALFLAVGS